VVFSVPEFKIPSHWTVFEEMVNHREEGRLHTQF
jgi:hypothetical protein